jgi:hypothetical protein
LGNHSLVKVSPGRRPDPRGRALAGLDALGPAAKDGLPALEKLLRENPPDPRALYVVARIGPAGLPVVKRALTNEVKMLRLEARVCMEMIRTHSEWLYGDTGFGPDAAIFDRRICEFNLKTLQAAFEDYRAEHPESVFPRGIGEAPPPSPPPDFMQAVQSNTAPSMTNRARPAAGVPVSRFE